MQNPRSNKFHKNEILNLKNIFFPVRGSLLFNIISKKLRTIPNVKIDVFKKKKLDKFLKTILILPNAPDYTNSRPENFNSIKEQIHNSKCLVKLEP